MIRRSRANATLSGNGRGGRDGFALAMALLATLLVAALLAALFFAVNQETRAGVAIASRDRLLAAAESALEAAMEDLEEQRPGASQIGSVESRSFEVNGQPAVVHTTRLDSGVFWLVAVVSDDGGTGAPPRRIGALAVESRVPGDSISIVRVTPQGWSELF